MVFDELLFLLDNNGLKAETDKKRIRNIFHFKKVKKSEMLLNKGDICNELYFIRKGLLRAFYYTQTGQEFTRLIANEKMFCSNWQSFTDRIPSIEYIQALEHSEILYVKYNDFIDLMEGSVAALQVYRNILEQLQIFHIKRFEFLTVNGSEQRVKIFLEENFELERRLTNRVAASYLQMTPETYCRLKSKF